MLKMDLAVRQVKNVDANVLRVEDDFSLCHSLLCVLHEIRSTQVKVNKLTSLTDTDAKNDKHTQS